MADEAAPESPQPQRKLRRGPTNPPANVESVFGKGHTEVTHKSPEPREDRKSRLKLEEEAKSHEIRQDEADQDLNRRKDWLAFRVFVGLLSLIAISSLLVLLVPWFSDEARKWATLSLTTILSMIAGYLVGKAQR